jgi:hypothetical protein
MHRKSMCAVNALYSYPYLNQQKPLSLPVIAYNLSTTKLSLPVIAYNLSTTKLEIRAK